MPKITNTSQAPQGVNTKSGVVYLKPGEGRDLDLEDVEMTALKKVPHVTIGEPPKDEDGDGVVDSTDRTALKAKADELGLDYPKNIPTEKLNDLVTAKLAEGK